MPAFLTFLAASVFTLQIAPPAAPTPPIAWRSVETKGGELRYVPPVITADDYPGAAQVVDPEGTSMIRLVIDPTGKILSCETASSAGHADLDAAACHLYRTRARFELRNIAEPLIIHAPVTWRLE